MRGRFFAAVAVGTILTTGGVAALHARSDVGKSQIRSGAQVQRVTWNGVRFDVVEVPLDRYEMHALWRPGGVHLRDVPGKIRTNAGIFQADFVPSGLLISRGATVHALNTLPGEGNFFLLPNGVFAIRRGAAVIERTSGFLAEGVSEATQSGPLLLAAGQIHPAFDPSSKNKTLRNAVGVRDASHVLLVMSRDPVSFWTLARFFRDGLSCPDALYLDGFISALWAKDGGDDHELDRGPFAGVLTVEERSKSGLSTP